MHREEEKFPDDEVSQPSPHQTENSNAYSFEEASKTEENKIYVFNEFGFIENDKEKFDAGDIIQKVGAKLKKEDFQKKPSKELTKKQELQLK